MDRPPAVDAALLQSMERFLPEGVVGAAALPDKILGLLPHGHTVGGAAALDDGEVLLLYRTAHLVFGGQQGRIRVRPRRSSWVTGEKQPMRPSRQRFM